jgi:hypothetical protein
VVDSPEEGSNIQNWLLCVEMLPAAVFMLFAFPHTEYKVAGGELSGGNALHALSIRRAPPPVLPEPPLCWGALRRPGRAPMRTALPAGVLGPPIGGPFFSHLCTIRISTTSICVCRDLVSDTVHQFAPAYHNYVLYSDGATKPSSRTTKTAGQEVSKATDKDDLLESMELGGMPTWPGGGQGAPALGGPEPGGSGQLGWLAGQLHSSELEVDSPPVLGKSKFLVRDFDPLTRQDKCSHALPAGR